MTIRLASTAYRLPLSVESVDTILAREHARVAEAMSTLTPDLRQRVAAGLGLQRVHVCTPEEEPYTFARDAAIEAIERASLRPDQIDLVIDYSTVPGKSDARALLAHRLSADLGAQAVSVNVAFAGCAGFHLAVKQALAMMRTDRRLRTAVLVAGDTAPDGSRSLLPITVQGDAASATVLVRDGDVGPVLVDAQVITLGHLHGLITLQRNGQGHDVLRVDAERLEQSLMPIYYLYFHRLLARLLPDSNVTLDGIDHVIYANISASDRDGFVRALGLDPSRVCTALMAECGHTFASDPVLNYTDLEQSGAIKPGQWLLFAGAGIGFTWGATLARR